MKIKKIKLYISRVMVMILFVLFFSGPTVVSAAEGTCGDALTWSFDGSTLTISGSGAMDNYTEAEPAPWHEFREQILWLSLPEGLTRIGTRAFAECTGLRTVELSDSVEQIQSIAFIGCPSLREIYIPASVTEIGASAFDATITICAPSGSYAIEYAIEYGYAYVEM